MTEPNKAPDPLPRLTLATLGGRDLEGRSGAEELFQEHLGEVLHNIARADTDATAKRTIMLKIDFTPNANRDLAQVEVTAQTKLAPLNSAPAFVALGLDHGEQVAVPMAEQMPLFGDQQPPQAPDLKPVPKTGTDNK